jgi:hypothetical protein
MGEDFGCPDKCSAGSSRIKHVEQLKVGITAQIARAAKLSSGEKVLTCDYCGCVWYRELDLHSLAHHTVRLGQFDGMYSRNKFVPSDDLQKAIDALPKDDARLSGQ